MAAQGYCKCKHCRKFFKPHRRNAHHQRFCSKPECRAASKRESQRKWRRKNPDYFRGGEHVARVQAWRRAHPGYWRASPDRPPPVPPDALQELLITQGFDPQGVIEFRTCLFREISQPLQEIIEAQSYLLQGVICMVTGDPLQDVMDGITAACYERGRRMKGPVSWGSRPGMHAKRGDTS